VSSLRVMFVEEKRRWFGKSTYVNLTTTVRDVEPDQVITDLLVLLPNGEQRHVPLTGVTLSADAIPAGTIRFDR
jgi:hypothetical protein